MRLLFSVFIFISSISYSQNCPTRIGDFIINETSIEIGFCRNSVHKIENGQDFVNEEIDSDMIDFNYGYNSTVYELKPDLEKISGWYNRDYASLSDSTRVFFMPYYQADDVSIKNLILKFKDGELFYIKASLSKDYFNVIAEKYKGKGDKVVDKKTNNKCKLAKLKKYLDSHTELVFYSDEDTINARITLDNKINSDCKVQDDRFIEIYNYEIYIQYLKTMNRLMKQMLEEKIENDKKEKIEKLKKF